jgi:hypothetical protein
MYSVLILQTVMSSCFQSSCEQIYTRVAGCTACCDAPCMHGRLMSVSILKHSHTTKHAMPAVHDELAVVQQLGLRY